MFVHNLLGVVVGAALSGLVASAAVAAGSESGGGNACFASHRVTKVLPYKADFTAGEGRYTALVGASAFVPAEPGLTGEWLYSELATRIGKPEPESSCPLDVPGINLSVQSAGPGFWVQISSKDRDAAKEVLRRAETLAPR
jgi:hypothetical protein